MNGFNDSRIKNNNETAQKYLERKSGKHRAEMELVEKAVSNLDGVQNILDAPCGYGRVSKLLENKGFKVTAMDLGDGIISCARQFLDSTSCKITKADLRHAPFVDNSFDAVLCFRFFHHLSTDQSRRIIVDELCRISKKYVLISYLSPYSITNVKRKVRHSLGGRKSSQNTICKTHLDFFFSINGFEAVDHHSQLAFFHSLHLATYKIKEPCHEAV